VKYAVSILPSARKALARLSKDRQRIIDAHIFALADNPRPAGAIPLKGEGRGLWRLRSGDWRILYQVHDKELVVLVVDIGHRRDVYRGL
jgi:mRNA interferase RelE/StbE